MNHQNVRVAIVGGGLSGLYAAHLLDEQGIHDWVLLEARARLGGRILSLPAGAEPETQSEDASVHLNRFDLGPTWFWPDFQPQFDRVVETLGLTRFEQFDLGDMMIEQTAQEPAMRMRGYSSSPQSMRLEGGMGTLIDALSGRLDRARIQKQKKVRSLRCVEEHIELACEDAAGESIHRHAQHVLLAIPPRLAVQTLDCSPPLPASLQEQWTATPTWMAPHAKFIAIYDRPFWREQGLSGQGRSAHGPMVEIHDASMPGGSGALSGFIGVPARARRNLSEETLRTHCLAQLVRLFGHQAAAPKAQLLKDWAADPHTATMQDLDSNGQHASAPEAFAERGPWSGRIIGIGSEWSPQYPGYLAGCVEAASVGVDAISRNLSVKSMT